MSRMPTRNGAQSRQPDGDDGELHQHFQSLILNPSTTSYHTDSSDICPVCKSARYLNPNMRFLINPECYHKMCESCVDRIFSQGPAPCPVAGCARTLRKQRFRPPKFEDLQIEREVDVRRRIAAVYALSIPSLEIGKPKLRDNTASIAANPNSKPSLTTTTTSKTSNP